MPPLPVTRRTAWPFWEGWDVWAAAGVGVSNSPIVLLAAALIPAAPSPRISLRRENRLFKYSRTSPFMVRSSQFFFLYTCSRSISRPKGDGFAKTLWRPELSVLGQG